NPVRLTFYNHQANRIFYFLNRFTVSYPRLFIADADQLIFDGDPASPRRYTIENFSQGEPTAPVVWEIGDRLQPRAITAVTVEGDPGPVDPSYRLFLPVIRAGSGQLTAVPQATGDYGYSFSSDIAGTRFIATNHAAVKTPASIERYDAPSLDPPSGAEWLVITHPAFMSAAQSLAAHRAHPDFGGLGTAVVSIEDVINQYGHGLPLPDAIRDYLSHALYTWDPAPQYVLLLGDATTNPHHATCDGPNAAYTLCNYWSDDSQITYVPTHLLFKDRFQGHIPTDYPNVLLAGDDLLPDMAIGRFAVQTAQEASDIVAKIVAYETGHLTPGPVQNTLVFLSDDPDSGGNFTATSAAIAAFIPDSYQVELVARAGHTAAEVEAQRTAVRDLIHEPAGATLMNYRGHGSIFTWGDNLFNANDPTRWPWPGVAPWLAGEPLVLLSLDCLDGNFIYPGQPGLGETFHALPGTGTVAHWSSTGLGYTFEHSVLNGAFFNAIFEEGFLPIGDAINYAKVQYALTTYHDSELWSFTLQGDPAMRLWRLDLAAN
ncbi:MAG: C25 family cysteine peptidase, partial [Anaerolineae bacterium]|nr:C25 family cysteine peptidase [Anaerolineae bacterium]